MTKVINMVETHKHVFTDEFINWIQVNEHMYELFEVLADQIWNAGRRHYSSRTIGEKMRFDHSLHSVDDTFKLRNSVTPYLGRLYVLFHPDRLELFRYVKDNGDFQQHVEFFTKIGVL